MQYSNGKRNTTKTAQYQHDTQRQETRGNALITSRGLGVVGLACGVEVVLALLRAKEIADFTDGAPEGVDGPDRAGSQKGLQLYESHLDRIEVGAIGREE